MTIMNYDTENPKEKYANWKAEPETTSKDINANKESTISTSKQKWDETLIERSSQLDFPAKRTELYESLVLNADHHQPTDENLDRLVYPKQLTEPERTLLRDQIKSDHPLVMATADYEVQKDQGYIDRRQIEQAAAVDKKKYSVDYGILLSESGMGIPYAADERIARLFVMLSSMSDTEIRQFIRGTENQWIQQGDSTKAEAAALGLEKILRTLSEEIADRLKDDTTGPIIFGLAAETKAKYAKSLEEAQRQLGVVKKYLSQKSQGLASAESPESRRLNP